MAATYVQLHYRFRTDATAAQGGTPTWLKGYAADQAVYCDVEITSPIRLRVTLQNTGNNAAASTFNLYYSYNSGAYTQITTTAGTNPVYSVDGSGGSSADNSAITSALLTAGAGTWLNGQYDDTGATSSFTLTNGDYTELEFSFHVNSAVVQHGDTLNFRVYRSTNALNTYTVTASLTCYVYGDQNQFRVRTDSTAAQGGTPVWAAAQNASVNVPSDAPFRIRVAYANTGTNFGAQIALYYSKNGGAWALVPTTSTGNEVYQVDATAGASANNSTITTSLLTGAPGTFSTVGTYTDSGLTSGITISNGTYAELEWGLEFNSAVAVAGDTYTFRMEWAGAFLFQSYSQVPSFTILSSSISGTLATTESGDATAIAGRASATGTLAASESAEAAAVIGLVSASGTAAATENADASSASGFTAALGAAAASESADLLASSGFAGSIGSASAVEASDVSAASGIKSDHSGSLAGAEAADSLSATARASAYGTLVANETGDLAVASGLTSATGSSASSESADLPSALGISGAIGVLAGSESADAAAGVGVAIDRFGSLAGSESADTATVAGLASATGTLTPAESADSAGIVGLASSVGAIAASESRDVLAAQGAGLAVTGALAASESFDAASSSAVSGLIGTLAAGEASDQAAASATAAWTGSLAAAETVDALAAAVLAGAYGTVAANDAADLLAAAGLTIVSGSLAIVEIGDVIAAIAASSVSGVSEMGEGPDVLGAAGSTGTGGGQANENELWLRMIRRVR
jgi:hypothetical protein